eukprot:TRINITY_DN9292_c0_g1_i1.p1 TRINITY_DN9292_c0_g1~~TRINITY_DN9292_c0_g1_i1.p1  ORF type:complete len:239 (+),score=82.86 TRINITY_DN9292_c0_g1_i1:111-827(+)
MRRTLRVASRVGSRQPKVRGYYYVASGNSGGYSNNNNNSNNQNNNHSNSIKVESGNQTQNQGGKDNNNNSRGISKARRNRSHPLNSAFNDFWSPFSRSGFGRDPFAQFDSFFNNNYSPATTQNSSQEAHWRPKIDVRESAKNVVVHAELPGLKKEDIKISVKDGVVTLSGERKFEEKKEEGDYSRVERSYGSFSRSFSVGDDVDPKSIKAKYNNGVLELTVPKPEQKVDQEHNVSIDD